GAGDPDNRRPMKFTNLSRQEQSVRDNAKTLITFRKSRMSLMYGDYQTRYLDDEVYAYSRNYLEESTLIILNNSGEKKDITIDKVEYNLIPYSFKTIITK
ncbi:hypothetical protein OAK19_05390, partial [Aureispira]|nr:hypothetical protein [Aureispira sp.]